MPDKFQDKYRIASNRLRGWNYATNGHYYITIVTADRKRLFGNIINGEMILNDIGLIVYDEFFKSFELRAELYLGEFILMPDHLHAIVILDKTDFECCGDGRDNLGGCVDMVDHVDVGNCVETDGRPSLQPTNPIRPINPTHPNNPIRTVFPQQPTPPQFQRQPKSISSFVAGFKSSTINRIDDWIDANNIDMDKFNRNNPLWQSNYHDHIIRNETEYQHIVEYIRRNPIEWKEE